jgi:NAD-dependent deacetylase
MGEANADGSAREAAQIRCIAEWLIHSQQGVAFTGAGISTESGVPDFRSPGGIWSRSTPVEFEDFLASGAARYEYWRQKAIAQRDFVESRPNVGHRLLASWQAAGWLRAIITQNIDGLHQDAGSWDVVELHGTARLVRCLDCNEVYDADPLVQQFLEQDSVPICPACGGRLKHATISFGQPLSPSVLYRASRLSREADLFLAMGSSLVVSPANILPQLAKQAGARLVIINREPTGLDALADQVVHASIGATLTAIHTEIVALRA